MQLDLSLLNFEHIALDSFHKKNIDVSHILNNLILLFQSYLHSPVGSQEEA